MLILNEVVMYGNMEEIKDEPPTIVVEIFDQDRVVSPFILICQIPLCCHLVTTIV